MMQNAKSEILNANQIKLPRRVKQNRRKQMATQISTSEFQEKVLNSNVPVLVDFFAAWCGPCKMMAPVLDEVSQEMGGSAAVYKVDVDQEMALAQQFNIMSVPTMIVFKGGKPVQQLVGVQPKQTLTAALA